MSLSQWANANLKVVLLAVVAVVAVVFSLKTVMSNQGPPRGAALPTSVWYYDLATGELFADKPGQAPPIMAPSGEKTGVLAKVYTCGACDEGDRFVLSLEKYTDQATRLLAESASLPPEELAKLQMQISQGRLVAAVPSSPDQSVNWLPAASPAGNAIALEPIVERCDGTPAKVCNP
jgi:hypothetical protein